MMIKAKQVLLFGTSVFSLFIGNVSYSQNKMPLNSSIISQKDTTLFRPIQLIPSNYATTHLPFFCDKELKLEKAIKFPIKFRIGSFDYVDRLENKH